MEPSLQAPPVVLLVAVLFKEVLLEGLLVALGRGFLQTALQPPQ
jgi:hypothetical protein